MRSTLSNSKLSHKLSFETIGTRWQIETATELAAETVNALFLCIQAYDKKWSRFRKDSVIYQLRSTPGKLPLDADEFTMFQLYSRLYKASRGKISPLVGNVLEATGYDSDYSLTPRHATSLSAASWQDTLELQQASLIVHRPVTIDIGAAGKGLLVDRLATILRATVPTFTLDASGDIYAYGHSERIGLEHPDDASLAIGVVQLHDQAVCGSAPNRRKWLDTNHIVDARSGRSITSLAAAWAVAETTMHADMASTALFFMSPTTLHTYIACHFITLYSDGTLRYSNDKDIEIYAQN